MTTRGFQFFGLLAMALFSLALPAFADDDSFHRGFVASDNDDSPGESTSDRTGATLSLPGRTARGAVASPKPASRGVISTPSRKPNSPQRGAYNAPKLGRGADAVPTRSWEYFTMVTGQPQVNGRVDATRSPTVTKYLGRVSGATEWYGTADRVVNAASDLQRDASQILRDGYNSVAERFNLLKVKDAPQVKPSTLQRESVANANVVSSEVANAWGALTTQTRTESIVSQGRLANERVTTPIITPPDRDTMVKSVQTLVQHMGTDGYQAALEAAQGNTEVTALINGMRNSGSHQTFFGAADSLKDVKEKYAREVVEQNVETHRQEFSQLMQSYGARATGDYTVNAMADPSTRLSSLVGTFRSNPAAYTELMKLGDAKQLSGDRLATYDLMRSAEGKAAWDKSGVSATQFQATRTALYGTSKQPRTPESSDVAYHTLIAPEKGRGGSTGRMMTDYMSSRLNDKTDEGNREFANMMHAMSTKIGDKQYLVFRDASGKSRMEPVTGNAAADRAMYSAAIAANMTVRDRYVTEPILGKDGKQVGERFKRDANGKPEVDTTFVADVAARAQVDRQLATTRTQLETAREEAKAKDEALPKLTGPPDAGGNPTDIGEGRQRFDAQLAKADQDNAVKALEGQLSQLETQVQQSSTSAERSPASTTPPQS